MKQKVIQLKTDTVTTMANKNIDLIEALQFDQDTMKSKLEAVEKDVKTLRRKNDPMLGDLIHQDKRIHNYTMKLTDLQARGMKTNIIIYGLEKGPSYPLQVAQSNQPLSSNQYNDDNNNEPQGWSPTEDCKSTATEFSQD